MIQDIPNAEDFFKSGRAQFDFAWDIVVSFLKIFNDASHYGIDAKPEAEEFWAAAKQRVQTALAITQQGVELIIKGKIIGISPYLLISGSPSDWPKPTPGRIIKFSDFRTIDAQDLIKVHDIYSSAPLPEEIKGTFESLRQQRNSIMHTVAGDLKIPALYVVEQILEMHRLLMPDEKWVSIRRDFLSESPQALLYSSDLIECQIVEEFYVVFSLLPPTLTKKFFDVNKKQRLYNCPECSYATREYSFTTPRYAVLRPNTSTSESLYCFVCEKDHHVTRKRCSNSECPGNVISTDNSQCCICSEDTDLDS